MKRWLAALLLMAVVPVAAGATTTLAQDDRVGTWVTAGPMGLPRDSTRRIDPQEQLTIGRDRSIVLVRRFADGTRQTLTAPAPMVRAVDDVVVATFPVRAGVTWKLVLSGWDRSQTRRLFGMLYLYDERGLFNGIPVTFQPEAIAAPPGR